MIFVREDEMPMKVRGYTSPDKDGNYNIYINRDLADEVKQRALEHELNHINKKHLYAEISVFELEKEVDE